MDFDDVLNESIECSTVGDAGRFPELDVPHPAGATAEQPKHKPEGSTGSPIGGYSEAPTHKPKDSTPIKTGSKQMDVNTWMDALKALKQTFNEGTEVIEQLASMSNVNLNESSDSDEFELDF